MKEVSKDNTIKTIQDNILPIAKDFHKYCEKEKLRRYLESGE